MTDPVAAAPAPRATLLPGCAAWAIGAPIGVVIGAMAITAWLIVHPQHLIDRMRHLRPALAEQVLVEGMTFHRGDGWTSPRSWRWHVDHLLILGKLPKHPNVLIDGLVVAVPQPSWSGAGWVLTFPTTEARRVDLHLGKVTERASPPPAEPGGLTLVFEALNVDQFALSMEQGLSPEVFVDATHVTLDGSFVARPAGRELIGSLLLDVATVEVAGVRIEQVHPSRLRFEDLGLSVIANARLGDAEVDITFDVNPLIGRARMDATAKLRRATLAGLATALLGPGKLHFLGDVAAKVTLSAGGDLGPGNLRGTAYVDVTGAGFVRPESKRAAVALAVALAPFLRFDDDGNVIVGDFHGDLSFTQRGITFDTVTYEAPHSVGELQGYVRGTAVSAKLHFRPLPRSGAIEWGFVLRGDIRKPKIALALPAVLRAWTPCEDAADCPLVGGAPKSEAESEEATAAALARAARAASKEDRTDARDARRADRQEVRDDHAAQREDARDVREAAQTARQEEGEATKAD